jgi:putative MATE family efflux protein
MQNELFERAPIAKAFFKFTLPVVMAHLVSLVYNMVDTYFIARTQNTSLVAGVSISTPVFTLMIALGDIWGIGGSSVISRLFGQKKDEAAKKISAICFYAAILTGIIVGAVMLLMRRSILGFLGADTETFSHASAYYTYIVLGAPFIILTLVPNNILRTEGFATAGMVGSILGSVVNIILDPILISYVGLGAAGAAIATVIGYLSTDLYYLYFLLQKSKKLSVSPMDCRCSLQEFGGILVIGIPASITNLMCSLSLTLTNRFLLPYGTDKVATMGIVMKINMLVVMVLVGFAFGAQPLIGYNYGAKNRKRLKEVLRFCYGFDCALACAMAAVLSLAAPFMIGLFMKDASIISAGSQMLRLQMMGMPFMAVVLVSTCTFQSAGKALGALLLSISRQGILFAVVLLTASRLAGYIGVISAQPISDFLTAALAGVLFMVTLQPEIEGKTER